VESITYASPIGGEVPALVVIPKGKGPFPGVIVQHGLGLRLSLRYGSGL